MAATAFLTYESGAIAAPLSRPAFANLLSAACNLTVGEFQLCAIPIGALGDDRIEIPRAAIDLPQFAAHFYVLVEVLEDCGYVQIAGVAPRQHLTELCQQTQGTTGDRGEESWSYLCPTTWFEYSKDDLLLWLRAADASQMELPCPHLHTRQPIVARHDAAGTSRPGHSAHLADFGLVGGDAVIG